jgi:hypothetical protein
VPSTTLSQQLLAALDDTHIKALLLSLRAVRRCEASHSGADSSSRQMSMALLRVLALLLLNNSAAAAAGCIAEALSQWPTSELKALVQCVLSEQYRDVVAEGVTVLAAAAGLPALAADGNSTDDTATAASSVVAAIVVHPELAETLLHALLISVPTWINWQYTATAAAAAQRTLLYSPHDVAVTLAGLAQLAETLVLCAVRYKIYADNACVTGGANTAAAADTIAGSDVQEAQYARMYAATVASRCLELAAAVLAHGCCSSSSSSSRRRNRYTASRTAAAATTASTDVTTQLLPRSCSAWAQADNEVPRKHWYHCYTCGLDKRKVSPSCL